MALLRVFTLLFSCCLHGGLLAVLWGFSGGEAPLVEEQVYHVALAQFAAPQQAGGVPSEPPSSQAPPPEPVQERPPVSEPVVKPVAPVSASKQISPRKKKASTSEQPVAPVSPVSPVAPVSPVVSGPVSSGTASGAAAGTAAGRGGPVQIGGFAAFGEAQVDERPSISRSDVPDYPKKARRMNVQGRVVVQIVVDTSGAPRECTVVESEPAGYFEESALNAARNTRFIPGKIKGKPVPTVVRLPFVFKVH